MKGSLYLLVFLAGSAPACAQAYRMCGLATLPETARAHFVEGLDALHNFWDPVAQASFKKVQQEEPDFVLAYWAEAVAHHDPFYSDSGLEEARAVRNRLGATPEARAARARTPCERAYLAALDVLLGPGEQQARHQQYAVAMRRLADQYPEDTEARAFHARALLGAVPAVRGDIVYRQEAVTAAEMVLAQNPHHPGALHYLIHALDTPETAHLALPAARTYARVVHDAPHGIHMPSHVYMQLGLWDEVVATNRKAYHLSVLWEQDEAHPATQRDFHTLDFLVYGYLQKGQYQRVKDILAEVQDLAEETGAGVVRYYAADWSARYVVESGHWQTEPLLPSGFGGRGELLGQGLNAVRTGNLEAAQKILQKLDEKVQAARQREGPTSRSTTSWTIVHHEVEALLRAAEGDTAQALALLEDAVALEKGLPPPADAPDPIKPPKEMLGEVLLDLNRPQKALPYFAQTLEAYPRRALSLLGLARAAAQIGQRNTALDAYQTLLRVWEDADPNPLPVKEAHQFIEQNTHRVSASY